MTNTRWLIVILAVIAAISVSAMLLLGTQVPGVTDIITGGGRNMRTAP
jgi:hypothetical protein